MIIHGAVAGQQVELGIRGKEVHVLITLLQEMPEDQCASFGFATFDLEGFRLPR